MNLRIILMMLLIVAFSFASCNKKQEPKATLDVLVGTWHCDTYYNLLFDLQGNLKIEAQAKPI